MEESKKNKAEKPAENKNQRLVKIRINQGRAISGVGKAGDVVEVSEAVARNFIGQGLAVMVKE